MKSQDQQEWSWYRCSITGCGAEPLWARPLSREQNAWSVGFTDSRLWVTAGPKPLCPYCGDELESLVRM